MNLLGGGKYKLYNIKNIPKPVYHSFVDRDFFYLFIPCYYVFVNYYEQNGKTDIYSSTCLKLIYDYTHELDNL